MMQMADKSNADEERSINYTAVALSASTDISIQSVTDETPEASIVLSPDA